MKFLLVLAFTTVAVAVPHGQISTIKDLFQGNYNERIISGTPAARGQFPWQVAINFDKENDSFFCGGALISNQWVLTAAHCAQGALRFQLKFGAVSLFDPEEGRVTVDTTEYIVHPGYNNYLNNDIALIKLPEPIQYTDKIKPIQLPIRGQHLGAGEKVTVSGWGKTSDEATSGSYYLNFVELTSISNDECTEDYGSWTIISSTVCCKGAPEHSTCSGDSGGPLIIYEWNGVATHVGVVSFVHGDGCASGRPSGYVRTESFLDWIHENTGV